MRLFQLNILLAVLLTIVQTNRSHPTKSKPDFGPNITNHELQIITKEYFKLSERNHLKFDKNVTIGFSKIDRSTVIGTCSYRPDFREIDLDGEYWKTATWATKVALTYHELTHCYCGRNHDFGNGTMYPDNSIRWIIQHFMAKQPFSPLKPAGFLADSCPQSIMYPVVLSNECFKNHYAYYVQEMFERCEPY